MGRHAPSLTGPSAMARPLFWTTASDAAAPPSNPAAMLQLTGQDAGRIFPECITWRRQSGQRSELPASKTDHSSLLLPLMLRHLTETIMRAPSVSPASCTIKCSTSRCLVAILNCTAGPITRQDKTMCHQNQGPAPLGNVSATSVEYSASMHRVLDSSE